MAQAVLLGLADTNGDVRAAAAKAGGKLAAQSPGGSAGSARAGEQASEQLLAGTVALATDRLPKVRQAAIKATGELFAARTRGGRKRQKKQAFRFWHSLYHRPRCGAAQPRTVSEYLPIDKRRCEP